MSEVLLGQELSISYLTDSNAKLHPANGAYGGSTSRGDFVINFYVERQKLPSMSKVTVNTDGSSETIEKDTSPTDIVREIQTSVVLSPLAAISLANWINERLGPESEGGE